MTVIVVGVSHRSAPFELLDRIAIGDAAAADLLDGVVSSDHVAEALVLTTCNRLEVYADVDRFHGAVEDIGAALAKQSGVPVAELTGHLYVHYDERAVHHIFSVAAGLDSMVVGEQQILGQVRGALRSGQEAGTVGRTLNELGQSALRVGKRVHAETAIDHHGASVVSVGLDRAAELLGGLAGRFAAVVGAGAMSALAVAHLRGAGCAGVVVVNRTRDNAERLVERLTQADPTGDIAVAGLAVLPEVLAAADVVVACTGATGTVVDLGTAPVDGRNRVYVDLALPHDVDPAVASLPGSELVTLASLAQAVTRHSDAEAAASAVVDLETRAYVAARAAEAVEPLVVSLRSRADGILEREVARLRLRLPQLDDVAAAEVERAMRRAFSALLHTPTVRMKELAGDPDGSRFTAAIQALFDLDPAAVQVITTPPEGVDD